MYLEHAQASLFAKQTNYKNKYLKYKNKYLELKSELLGGKIIVGESKPIVDRLLCSNLTVINAHGSVNITKHYSLPENVYLLTTSDIGGITCSIYNNVFRDIINDSINRTNLKNILGTTSKTRQHDSKSKIIRTIYKGGNIIYEPGDLIPMINLGFNHNDDDDSSKSIYGIFNFEPYDSDNVTKTSILQEYNNLTSSEPQTVRNEFFKIGDKFNKNRLIKIIGEIKEKGINIDVAFNDFSINPVYKKYFAEPNDLDFNTVCNKEANAFITMCVSLLYQRDNNKLDYTIKDIVDSLDKTQINLIVLTSCLHTKIVYLDSINKKIEYFRTKHPIYKIPETLNEYNITAKKQVQMGEYFEDKKYIPYYELDRVEISYFDRLNNIYKDWEQNKIEITDIIKERLTENVFDFGVAIRDDARISTAEILVDMLFNCIMTNNHNIIKLIRKNIMIRDFDILHFTNQKIINSDISEPNQALDEFYKFKHWQQPDNFTYNFTDNFTKKTTYQHFEDASKKSLWKVLLSNGFKWYNWNNWNNEYNVSIIDKLLSSRKNDVKLDGIHLDLIKDYFTNSKENLLDLLIKDNDIHNDVFTNIDKFESIIITNVDKSNLVNLLKKIMNNSKLYTKLDSILLKNKINLYKMSSKDATNILINLYDGKGLVFKELIDKFQANDVNLNEPNEYGYNIHSYIIATNLCSIIRTRSGEYEYTGIGAEKKLVVAKKETKKNKHLDMLSKLGINDNGKVLDVSIIPLDFKGLDRDLKLDGVKCKNWTG
jgi:hypothetical protein